MDVQLVNGKWTLNGKMYHELFGAEKRIFEVLIAVKQIIRKYNL